MYFRTLPCSSVRQLPFSAKCTPLTISGSCPNPIMKNTRLFSMTTWALEDDKRKSIFVPASKLKKGYKLMHSHLKKSTFKMVRTAIAYPSISVTWSIFTEQIPYESPFSITCLAVGGVLFANCIRQQNQLKLFQSLSILCDNNGPTKDAELNRKINKIINGQNSKVKTKISGIVVQSLNKKCYLKRPLPSQDTLHDIYKIKSITIPQMALTGKANLRVDKIYASWLVRLWFLPSIYNLGYVLEKATNPMKSNSWHDFFVSAYSMFFIYQFLSKPGIKVERQNFRNYLNKASNSKEVVDLLIDETFLAGGMLFMKHWTNGIPKISLRITRGGEVKIYRNKDTSYFGPMQVEKFPKYLIPKSKDLTFRKFFQDISNIF